MLVEVLLQLLIGKVNVELLKAVHLKVLKTKNVQHPDKLEGFLAQKSVVDTIQDPSKYVGIQGHANGISRVTCLVGSEGVREREEGGRGREGVEVKSGTKHSTTEYKEGGGVCL